MIAYRPLPFCASKDSDALESTDCHTNLPPSILFCYIRGRGGSYRHVTRAVCGTRPTHLASSCTSYISLRNPRSAILHVQLYSLIINQTSMSGVMDAAPVFRVDKRRKLNHLARKRSASDDDEVEQSTVVRKLKQPKARGGGLQVASIQTGQDVAESQTPDPREQTPELPTNAFQNRFIGSMGRKASHDERLYVSPRIGTYHRRHRDLRMKVELCRARNV